MTERMTVLSLPPAAFELKHHDDTCECAWWTVVHAEAPKGNKSNVEQFVGLEFRMGDSPDLRPRGYGQRIQRALNNMGEGNV